MNKYKNFTPVVSGILFLVIAVISVSSAWISDIHKYDLAITFSGYVGLSHFTSTLYFITVMMIIVMLVYYIVKTKMHLIKRIAYSVVLPCIFATALFPYNYYSEAPTDITINLHNDFAICLMLVTTVSFILTAVLSKNKKQRVTSVISIIYAVAFIVLFIMRFKLLFQTIFIWENLFILLLLLEMHLEQYGELVAESNDR